MERRASFTSHTGRSASEEAARAGLWLLHFPPVSLEIAW